jgi:hypothetical protein
MSIRDDNLILQGTKVQASSGNSQEARMVRLLDEKATLERYSKQLEKLEQGTLSVPGFLKQLAGPMMQKILYTIETTKDERLKVSAAQDLLDRAGHGKVTKAVVAHHDMGFKETKRELVNSVITLARKAGIKVKDDSYVEGDEEVYEVEAKDIKDVTPRKCELSDDELSDGTSGDAKSDSDTE